MNQPFANHSPQLPSGRRLQDPYWSRAFFALGFKCQRCGNSLAPDPTGSPTSLNDYQRLADEARGTGWYCIGQDSSMWSGDSACLCPDCAPVFHDSACAVG